MNVQQINDLTAQLEIAGKQAMQRMISEGGWPALAASTIMTSATSILENMIKWVAGGRTFEGWNEDFVSQNKNKDLFDTPELAPFYDECVKMVDEGDLRGYYEKVVLPSTADMTVEDLTAQLEHHRQCLIDMAEEPCTPHVIH